MALFTINNPANALLTGGGGNQGSQTQVWEFGVRIVPTVNGFITAVRFFKDGVNPGLGDGLTTRAVNVWNAAGTRLATASSGTEPIEGWIEVPLSTPLAVTAGTAYFVTTASGLLNRRDANFPPTPGIPAILGNDQVGYLNQPVNTWSASPGASGGVWRGQDVVFSDTPLGPVTVQATSNFREADRYSGTPGVNSIYVSPLITHGDSFTQGVGATPGNGYVDRFRALVGLTVTNRGVGGSQISNVAARMFNGNDALNPKSLSIVEVGYNDTHFSPDTEILKRIQWPILGAMLINAAIKDTDKLRGTAGTRTGFGFLNNPFPGAVTSNTAGDTWQGTFTGPIGYLCIVPATSWGSRVNFEVDGINRGSINSWITELPVNESGGYAPVVIRFAGLSAGVHTVRVIMGAQTPGSSSANFGICWLAAAVPGPTVLFATIPDYIPSARRTEWVQAYLDLYSILRNDGLNIRLSRWDLINVVAGDLDPDNVHFADPGYLKAANLLNADAFGAFAPVVLPGLAQEQRLFRQLEFLVPGVSNFRNPDRFFSRTGLPITVSSVTPLVSGPGEKVILTVSDALGATGVSIQGVQALDFNVLYGARSGFNPPVGVVATDGPYEIGYRFNVTAQGVVRSVSYVKVIGGPVGVISFWDQATQTLIRQITFSGESASGRQTQLLSPPLILQPGIAYRVSTQAGPQFTQAPGAVPAPNGLITYLGRAYREPFGTYGYPGSGDGGAASVSVDMDFFATPTQIEATVPFGVSGQGQFAVAGGGVTLPTGPFITINPRLGAASSNKSRNRKYYGLD